MKQSIFAILILLSACARNESQDVTPKAESQDTVQAESVQDRIKALASANGFDASDEIADAIANAANAYQVDALQLTAIGIIESGLGKNAKTRKNRNGTLDRGVFQINTVNLDRCKAFHIDTVEGSAFCAAKILSQIKMVKPSDVAKYHSKTPSKKSAYFAKITKVLQVASDK